MGIINSSEPEGWLVLGDTERKLLRKVPGVGAAIEGLKTARSIAEARPYMETLVRGLRAVREDMMGTVHWKIEDSPGSLRRLVWYEDAEISIALTHFYGQDLLVHDHRRLFYSRCLSGSYTHRLYGRTTGKTKVFKSLRTTGGQFSRPHLSDDGPALLMEHDHYPGNLYLMTPAALHRIECQTSAPVVTLLVKVAGRDPIKTSSTFYFDDPATDPGLLANQGRLRDLVGIAERRATLAVFSNALGVVSTPVCLS